MAEAWSKWPRLEKRLITTRSLCLILWTTASTIPPHANADSSQPIELLPTTRTITFSLPRLLIIPTVLFTTFSPCALVLLTGIPRECADSQSSLPPHEAPSSLNSHVNLELPQCQVRLGLSVFNFFNLFSKLVIRVSCPLIFPVSWSRAALAASLACPSRLKAVKQSINPIFGCSEKLWLEYSSTRTDVLKAPYIIAPPLVASETVRLT